MQASSVKTLVLFTHSAAVIALLLPLLMLTGGFPSGQSPKVTVPEASQVLVGNGIKPLSF